MNGRMKYESCTIRVCYINSILLRQVIQHSHLILHTSMVSTKLKYHKFELLIFKSDRKDIDSRKTNDNRQQR